MNDSANPYAASAAPLAKTDATNVRDDYGGLTRLHFFLGWLGMVVLAMIPILGILNLVISPILAWHRMKNIGHHPAMGLLILVPIANIWAGIMCLAAPTGYKDHKTLDTAGKVIMGIFIGLIVLIIVAAVFGAMANSGSRG